jgi:molybdopterin converting factor small subunit
MLVRIRLGSGLSRLAHAPLLSLELPDGATVGDVYDQLTAAQPELAPALRSALPVRAGEHVGRGEALRHGDEVALLLPVAGGDVGHPAGPGGSAALPGGRPE